MFAGSPEESVTALVNLGFSPEAARNALRACDDDVNEAAVMLLTHNGEVPAAAAAAAAESDNEFDVVVEEDLIPTEEEEVCEVKPIAELSPEQEELVKSAMKRDATCSLLGGQSNVDSLTCSVCLDIMNDPVVHPACGNMFCANCVKSLQMCPLCRGELEKGHAFGPVPRMILNMISDLRVSCDQCHEEMTRQVFLEQHKKNCTFPCPLGCGCPVNSSTVSDHCRGGSCSKCVLSCPASISPLSCTWHGSGGDEFKKHSEQCQLIRLIPYVVENRKTIERLQRTVSEHERTIKQLEKTLKESRRVEAVSGVAPPIIGNPSSMTITVAGPFSAPVKLGVRAGDTIASVKARVELQKRIHAVDFSWNFNGKELDDRNTLADFNIPDGATINLVQKPRRHPWYLH